MVSFLSGSQYTYFRPWTFNASASNVDNVNDVDGTNNNNGVNGANNSNNANNNSNVNGSNNAANTGDITAPASDDYKSQFEAKLNLIKKYCADYIVIDENGDEIDVEKIRNKYADKYEEGVKYCDELINSFDQDKVEKIVKNQYKKRVDAKSENGKKVADQWVKTILDSGLEAPKLSTSGVNANNVLDVIGAFVTNEDVKNGKVSLSQLFENPNTAETLVSAIKAKAQSFIKRKDLAADVKETIIAQTNELVDARYDYSDSDTNRLMANRENLVNKYMTLFETLRTEEAKLNDEAAPKYYGLPDEFNTTFTNESDKANEEINAHKSRRRLNTNM